MGDDGSTQQTRLYDLMRPCTTFAYVDFTNEIMNFAGTTLFCNSLISILSSIVAYFTSDDMMFCLSVYNYANFFFVACFIFICLFFQNYILFP